MLYLICERCHTLYHVPDHPTRNYCFREDTNGIPCGGRLIHTDADQPTQAC